MSDQVGNHNVGLLMTRLNFYLFLSFFTLTMYTKELQNLSCAMGKWLRSRYIYVCITVFVFLNCIIPSYYHNFKNILPTTDTHIKYKSATHNEPVMRKTAVCFLGTAQLISGLCICFHCKDSTKSLFFLIMLNLI